MATRVWLRPARALIASAPARSHVLAVPRIPSFAFRPTVRALHTCGAVRLPAPPLAEVLPPHKADGNSGGSSGGADNASGNGSNSSAAGGRSWSTRIGVAFFLSTAAFALYLGTWQVKRRAWKEDLVTRRTAALQSEPLDLVTYLKTHSGGVTTAGEAVSSSASAGSSLAPSSKGTSDPADVVPSEECRRMTARGRFLHGRTLLLGPRSPPSPDGASTAGQGIGYFLITPFRLADGRLVLVNRGWCAKDKCAPGSLAHLETDKDEEVEIVGVLRKGEQHPQFLTDSYDPLKSESFIWLDLPLMARATGVTEPGATDEPVLLDALEVNGNKNRNMRRRTVGDYIVFTTTPMIHSVYAATWFTLSAALVALTFIRFKKKVPQQARTAINRR